MTEILKAEKTVKQLMKEADESSLIIYEVKKGMERYRQVGTEEDSSTDSGFEVLTEDIRDDGVITYEINVKDDDGLHFIRSFYQFDDLVRFLRKHLPVIKHLDRLGVLYSVDLLFRVQELISIDKLSTIKSRRELLSTIIAEEKENKSLLYSGGVSLNSYNEYLERKKD